MVLEISPLLEQRWNEYRDLRLESLKRDPKAFGSAFEEEKDFSEDKWKDRTKNCLFAFQDGIPVGMIVFLPSNRKKTSHLAHIFAFYVKEEYRGKGIGTALLNEALNQLKYQNKIIKVILSVNPKQKAACRLYEKAGFINVGKFTKNAIINGEFQDELLMELFF